MKFNQQDAYNDPLGVEMYDGEVVISGPGRIDVSLTAQAAARTAQRLAAAARQALERNAAQPVTNASQAALLED